MKAHLYHLMCIPVCSNESPPLYCRGCRLLWWWVSPLLLVPSPSWMAWPFQCSSLTNAAKWLKWQALFPWLGVCVCVCVCVSGCMWVVCVCVHVYVGCVLCVWLHWGKVQLGDEYIWGMVAIKLMYWGAVEGNEMAGPLVTDINEERGT